MRATSFPGARRGIHAAVRHWPTASIAAAFATTTSANAGPMPRDQRDERAPHDGGGKREADGELEQEAEGEVGGGEGGHGMSRGLDSERQAPCDSA
jgi:hypothetical protein